MLQKSTFLIIDGNSLMHRAFHALPLMDADGTYTNAIHGFLQMILKVIKDEHIQYVAVCFDEHGPTFRHTAYPDYKAGRAATPPELRQQFETIRTLLDQMGIKRYGLVGWEADDLLGTLSQMGVQKGLSPILLTGDRDALQLVSNDVELMFTRKGISDTIRFTPEKVVEEYGFSPDQVTDWKGLAGDSSDNIPGIQGIGDKTAVKLLQTYGNLDEIFLHASEVKGKLGEKLRAGEEIARMCKSLATIRKDAPVEFKPEDCLMPDLTHAIPALQQLRLNQIIRRFIGTASDTQQESKAENSGFSEAVTIPGQESEISSAHTTSDKGLLHDQKPALLSFRDETVVHSSEELQNWFSALPSSDNKDAILGIMLSDTQVSFATLNGCFASVPIGGDFFHLGLEPSDVLALLTPVIVDRPFVVHDLKHFLHELDTCHMPVPMHAVWDTMLGAYLLNPQEKSFSFDSVSHDLPADARGVLTLYLWQKEQITRENMLELMDSVELPLSYTLFHMEKAGFRIDGTHLRKLGEKYTHELEQLRHAIWDACGEEFNLNSPKQLSEVLFEKLKLPHGKKTSKGYSTSVEVLEDLRPIRPDVIEPMLRYRQLTKLNGTYIESLLPLMDAEDRIHSFFDQTATATGRISSSEPNLQNIPVRTEEGREIREAFLPRDGWTIVDADYSQIELRLMAHFSGDHAMVDAFVHGQDVHARTASEIFDVPMDEVTPTLRSRAKAVNFGLIYGISSFGLARNTGVSRQEAAQFMSRYFERYPGVKEFMDRCIEEGEEHGYASTIMGRRRYLPELRDSKAQVREFGKRVAMNMPVQGTAADIIKIAMVRVDEALREQGMQSRLILQVHDELILECPPEEVDKASQLLKESMENVIQLRVPLIAEVHHGKNWSEAK